MPARRSLSRAARFACVCITSSRTDWTIPPPLPAVFPDIDMSESKNKPIQFQQRSASNVDQVKRAEQEEKRTREQHLADVREIVQLPAGRRYLWRLMAQAGINRNPFTGSSSTFFNCGMQAIGTNVLNDILEADPEQYIAMIREHQTETV